MVREPRILVEKEPDSPEETGKTRAGNPTLDEEDDCPARGISSYGDLYSPSIFHRTQ